MVTYVEISNLATQVTMYLTKQLKVKRNWLEIFLLSVGRTGRRVAGRTVGYTRSERSNVAKTSYHPG